MILKCFDGPMDGAVYVLTKETSEPEGRSTNRKPDGFWFNGYDDMQRNVQHQYEFEFLEQMGDDVCQCYRYTGPVVDTGIEFATSGTCEHGVADGDWCEPCNKAMKEAIAENQE